VTEFSAEGNRPGRSGAAVLRCGKPAARRLGPSPGRRGRTLECPDARVADIDGPKKTTLPMALFLSVRVGLNPEINAIGTLMITTIAVIVGITVLAVRFGHRPRPHT